MSTSCVTDDFEYDRTFSEFCLHDIVYGSGTADVRSCNCIYGNRVESEITILNGVRFVIV